MTMIICLFWLNDFICLRIKKPNSRSCIHAQQCAHTKTATTTEAAVAVAVGIQIAYIQKPQIGT